MKAIVSVFARDAKGITAYITAALAEQNINILLHSGGVLQGGHVHPGGQDAQHILVIELNGGADQLALMLVDLAECEMPFDRLSQHLRSVGEARGLAVHVQRQDIFDAMHRI